MESDKRIRRPGTCALNFAAVGPAVAQEAVAGQVGEVIVVVRMRMPEPCSDFCAARGPRIAPKNACHERTSPIGSSRPLVRLAGFGFSARKNCRDTSANRSDTNLQLSFTADQGAIANLDSFDVCNRI